MDRINTTKDIILRYWKSWQNLDWDEMEDTLAAELDFSGQVIGRKEFIEMCKSGSSWENVVMLSSVFSENEGALLYEGTDSKNGKRIRVGEFVVVKNGKVFSSIACFGSGMPPV